MNDRGTAEPCAGCGRAAAEANKMLPARAASAHLFICDRCVDECARAIGDAPTRIPGATPACAFCAKPEDSAAIIVAVGSNMICDECVDHYREALDSDRPTRT